MIKWLAGIAAEIARMLGVRPLLVYAMVMTAISAISFGVALAALKYAVRAHQEASDLKDLRYTDRQERHEEEKRTSAEKSEMVKTLKDVLDYQDKEIMYQRRRRQEDLELKSSKP